MTDGERLGFPHSLVESAMRKCERALARFLGRSVKFSEGKPMLGHELVTHIAHFDRIVGDSADLFQRGRLRPRERCRIQCSRYSESRPSEPLPVRRLRATSP